MKLLLLSFFSFALCAIQKPFPEDAFQAYFLKVETISREEFSTIDDFISRVEEADDKDLITEQDKEMLIEMGFEFFLSSLSLPQCFGDQGKAYSHLTWGEINDSTKLLETRCDKNNTSVIFENGVPFAKVLRFIYSYESVDALSREDFFRRHYLLFFLKGGKHMNIIRKLKSLHQVYGSVLSNSILEYFAQKNEEFISVLFSILTPTTLSIDLGLLDLRFTKDIDSIVENILKSLAEGFQFSGFSKLEKVAFRLPFYSETMQTSLFRILERNAENLTSLEIYANDFFCLREILFPNVKKLSLRIRNFETFDLKFLQHSNYTTLNLGHDITFTDISGQEYFEISSVTEDMASLISLIEDNKNLDTLAWNFFCVISANIIAKEALKSFKLAVDSLKNLCSFEFYHDSINFKEHFEDLPSLDTLTVRSFSSLNWESLSEKFPNLKHLAIHRMQLRDLGQFVQFVEDSQLQSASLKFAHQENVSELERNLLSALSKRSTLQKIDLEIFFDEMIAFELDEKFQAIDFYHAGDTALTSKVQSLPFGPGVQYLRIQIFSSREKPFTSEGLGILKEKFPNLNRLVLPYGSIVQVQPGEFGIEVQTTTTKFDEFLNQFLTVTLYY